MKKLLIIALAGILLAGCGYTTSSLLPSAYKTIYVKDFKNKITYSTESHRNLYFPLLEVKITEAVIDRFMFDGNLRIAKEDTADLILVGELLDYQREPLRYEDNNEDVLEYRLNIIVSLELWDNAKEKLLWRENHFVGETTYFTSGPLAKSENVAIQDGLTDLARRIVERTIEDW